MANIGNVATGGVPSISAPRACLLLRHMMNDRPPRLEFSCQLIVGTNEAYSQDRDVLYKLRNSSGDKDIFCFVGIGVLLLVF